MEPGRSDSHVKVTLGRPGGEVWFVLRPEEAVTLAGMLLACSQGE